MWAVELKLRGKMDGSIRPVERIDPCGAKHALGIAGARLALVAGRRGKQRSGNLEGGGVLVAGRGNSGEEWHRACRARQGAVPSYDPS